MKTLFTRFHFLSKRIIPSLVLIFLAGNIFPQNNLETKGSWNCYKGRIQHKTTLNSKSINSPVHSFDVLKYTLNLDLYDCYFSPYPNSFHGSVIIQFKVDSTLNKITLNALDAPLAIDAVSMSGVSFSRLNDILTINLDQTYNAGDTTEVKITYHHLNLFDDAFYTGGGFAYTDAEPERARSWFPCWDRPSDKALLDLTARVPDNVLLASNGRLADSIHIADTIYYHWVSRDPIATYLVAMTSKLGYNLDVLHWPLPSNPNVKIPIRYYYNTGENPVNSESVILDMTTYYSDLFCEHPFEKNGFCTLDPQFMWGGMENQTLTSFCQNCWSENLTAHEFAHQWFGDMITCGTWADIFLNEAFATYCEALWDEHAYGYPQYKTDIVNDANYYLTYNPGWAISDPAWALNTPSMNDLFNYAVTYCKGSSVLHMFRYVVGDSLFFASLKAYASDTVNFKYKNSVIADFKTKMNQACAQNLDWFFDEWLFQANHPVYSNTYSFYNNGNGTWTVNFLTSQVQTNTGFFKMPIELHIDFNNGTDTLVKVMNNVNNQLFQIIFNKQPTALAFDPNDNIVLKEGTTLVGISEYNTDQSSVVLYQNNPNPFSDNTQISFELPASSLVKVSIYDVFGKLVAVPFNSKLDKGKHEIDLSGTKLAQGIYFYNLDACGQSLMKKMAVK